MSTIWYCNEEPRDDYIAKARQAQQEHERRIDVQLEIPPAGHIWATREEFEAFRESEIARVG